MAAKIGSRRIHVAALVTLANCVAISMVGAQVLVPMERKISPESGDPQISRVETTIAIHPTNPSKLIAAANYQNPSFPHGLAPQEIYYSQDGGLSWGTTYLASQTGSFDPTLGWSAGGIAYAVSLPDYQLTLYRSSDFGATWPISYEIAPGGDKPFLHVVNPPIGNPKLYLAWTGGGGTMWFTRLEDKNGAFHPPAENYELQAPCGIGADVTTDGNNVFYLYHSVSPEVNCGQIDPLLSGGAVLFKRSTNDGDTFATHLPIKATNSSYEWKLPASQQRGVRTILSVDIAPAGLPTKCLYATWADLYCGPGQEGHCSPAANACENHSTVYVYRSCDADHQTWVALQPFPNNDWASVDRFHPWIAVDQGGIVHLTFYDTRKSAGLICPREQVSRTGVDLYYTFSENGGATWKAPRRVSGATSYPATTNGFDWGEYQGLAVSFLGSAPKAFPAWTDNRDGSQAVYSARLELCGNNTHCDDGDSCTSDQCLFELSQSPPFTWGGLCKHVDNCP